MKKLVYGSALATALIISSASFAGFHENTQMRGGFQGPGLTPVSVAEALKMSDDTPVALVGSIEKSLGHEKYLFKDQTGSITIEIDDKDWRGLQVTPQDTIEVIGEIDKDWTSIEVDVDQVRKK